MASDNTEITNTPELPDIDKTTIDAKTLKIYIQDLNGDDFSKTSVGKKIVVVAEYLRALNENMQQDIRNKHYKVTSFDFERHMANKLNKIGQEIIEHLKETGHLEEVNKGEYDDYIYATFGEWYLDSTRGQTIHLPKNDKSKVIVDRNIFEILLNLDQIHEYALAAKTKTPEVEEGIHGQRDDCITPSFAKDKVYPFVEQVKEKHRGQSKESHESPLSWKAFVDTYIKFPKPKIEKLEDSLSSAPHTDKEFLTKKQYAEQKAYFEKATRNPSTEGFKKFGKQYSREVNSFFKPGEKFFEKENIESLKERLGTNMEAKMKHHRLWSEVVNKICPTTMMEKVLECTLPPLECKELIKEFGLKNILPTIRQFESFDPRLRKIRKKWESKRASQNVKAIKFTNKSHMVAEPNPGGIHENLKEFSVSLWVRAKSNDNKSGTHIFSHYRTKPDAERAFAIKVGSRRNIKVTFHGDGTYENRKQITSSQRVFDSEWHHVLVTFDGPKDTIKIFINGKEDLDAKVDSYADFDTIFNSSSPITFAASGNRTRNYTGFLDEVVLFNKALSASHSKDLSDPKLVLRNSPFLLRPAMHWWRMGDDQRDKTSRTTNEYTRQNRIHDQIGDMHGTPKNFNRRESNIYEAHPFDDKMLDEFVKIIEEVINLEIFCQILIILLFKAFGLDIPKFGGFGGIPKLKTNNPFGDLLKLLENAAVQLVVDIVLSTILALLESLAMDCDDINKLMQGDLAGTKHGKFVENFGDLLDKVATGDLNEINKSPLGQSLADLAKQSEDFLTETGQFLEDTIKNGTVTKYKDPITGEARDYSSALKGFDIVTPDEVGGDKFSDSNNWMEQRDNDEKKSEMKVQKKVKSLEDEQKRKTSQAAIRKQVFCNPTKDLGRLLRDVSVLVSPDECLRMLSGNASINTLEVVTKIVNTKYPHLSFLSENPEKFNEAFGMFGVFTGLDGLRDRIMEAADDISSTTARNPSYCPLSRDEDFFNRKKALEKVSNGNLSDEEMDNIINSALEDRKKRFKNLLGLIFPEEEESDKCDKDVYASVPQPKIIEEALSRTVQATVSSIVSAYDTDMLLYKPAITEQKMGKRKVPKILWAGENIQVTTVDEGKLTTQNGKLQDTIINPEFRGMIGNGHIPTRKDGKPDGTEFGAVLKTKWWPPWEEGWLEKTERIPLGKGEEGESLAVLAGKDEPSVDDLPGSLGPYTDYDTEKGGSEYAFKDAQDVVVAANVRRHLRTKRVEENYFSGRSQYTFKARNFDDESSNLLKELNKEKKKLKFLKHQLSKLKKMKNNSTTFFGFSFSNSKIDENITKVNKALSLQKREVEKTKKEYLIKVSKTSVEDRLYADKAYYGLDGVTEASVISNAAALKGYADPAPKLPTFNVTYANQFGTILENDTSFSVRRFGKDKINIHVIRKNEVDESLKSIILEKGYDPSSCDTAQGWTEDSDGQLRNNYTSQENLFAHLISQKWQSYYNWTEEDKNTDLVKSDLKDSVDDNDEDDMMESTYDDIMRKTLILLAQEVSNTPLLTEIEGTKNNTTNKSAIGIQFVDVNPTQSKPHKQRGIDPRIMDFLSFVNQIKEDYKFFTDCKIGEVNIDGKRAYKTPLSLALRAAHPNMIARLYSIEFILQAIFPMVEFDTELTPLIETVLMQKIRNDMIKRPGYYKEFKDNCLEMQNLKSEHGMLDEPIAETYEEAFAPILKKEFAFALEKIKQVVLKECSEDSEENDKDSDPSSDSEEVSPKPGLELKNILLDNIDVIDVREDRFSKISLGLNSGQRKSLRKTKKAIRTAQKYINNTNKIITRLQTKDLDNPYLSDNAKESKILSSKRKEFKERQKKRKEFLNNELVKKNERFKDKNRIDFFSKGQLYLERYVKSSDGKIMTKISNKDVNLDSSNHLLDEKVEQYGIRLVYVELPERNKKTPLNEDVDVGPLMNLNTPGKNEYLYSVKDGGFLDDFESGNFDTRDFGKAKVPKIDSKGRKMRRSDGSLIFKEEKLKDVRATFRERTLFVHPIADFSIDADELLDLLGIDRDLKTSKECFEPQGVTGPGKMKNGSSFNHYHEYSIDENGNGFTTTLFGDFEGIGKREHEHEIRNFRILKHEYVPGIEETEHVHEIMQGSDISGIEELGGLTSGVSKKIFSHLMQELRDSDDFRIMFEYCFDLQSISSVVSTYAYLANSTRDLLRMFDVTKRRLENYLFNAQNGSDYFNSAISCNQNSLAKSMYNMGNTNLDDLWNPSLLLMILMTPLHIYKGWVKTADPHCLITQTVVDLGNAGFLIPKLETQKIEIPFTDPVECSEVTLPTLPGIKIAFPGFTQLVAAGVTYAPLLVSLPPYMPSPYGLIYYLVVDPLLMLMASWWLPIMMNDENSKNALKNAGLDLDKDVPLCLPGETTPIPSANSVSSGDDEDDGCAPLGPDPVDVGGYGKANC